MARNSSAHRIRWLTGLVVLSLLGCKSSKEIQVISAVERVQQLLEEINHRPIAAAAYQSAVEGGGTVANYLAAEEFKPEDYGCTLAAETPQPFSIRILNATPGGGEIVIEGYGEDLKKPLKSVTARIQPASATKEP
jgi:hypothetical protein